eukprot:174021-Chlamydomonas_euryale.AAC.1
MPAAARGAQVPMHHSSGNEQSALPAAWRLKKPDGQAGVAPRCKPGGVKTSITNPRQRKGMFIRDFMGARRATFHRSFKPISKGQRWSFLVHCSPNTPRQPQVCNGKGELRPNFGRDLAKFEKTVCHELARGDAAAMATTLVAPASTPLT